MATGRWEQPSRNPASFPLGSAVRAAVGVPRAVEFAESSVSFLCPRVGPIHREQLEAVPSVCARACGRGSGRVRTREAVSLARGRDDLGSDSPPPRPRRDIRQVTHSPWASIPRL